MFWHAQTMSALRETYEAVTADLEPPFAMVDLAAFRANAADMTRRAHGRPIRVASKSIRSRALLRAAVDLPGYQGIMAFTLPEALWLATASGGGTPAAPEGGHGPRSEEHTSELQSRGQPV